MKPMRDKEKLSSRIEEHDSIYIQYSNFSRNATVLNPPGM